MPEDDFELIDAMLDEASKFGGTGLIQPFHTIRSALDRIETEHGRLREALQTIAGPASNGDAFIEVYRAAGGGYEGLQAVATAALGAKEASYE